MFPLAPDALPPLQGVKHFFFVPMFSFASIGTDPTSLQRTIFSRLLAWTPLLSIFTLLFPMTIYASQYRSDLKLVTDALSPVWQSSLSVMKYIIFAWNREKIVKLVREIWMWNLEAHGEELQIIAKENRKYHKIAFFYYITVFVTGWLALLSPFVVSAYFSWRGDGFWNTLETPLKGTFFVDTTTYFGYCFVWIWECVGIYYVINGNLSADSLFSWFTYNISAQFQILNLRFKRASISNADEQISDEKFRRSIRDCVDYHLRIIAIVDMFNEIYSSMVFIKFAISCMQIACLAYQFARGAQLFHLSFLFAVTLQLMLYCYGGQRLQDESTSVAVAIYEHFHWQDLSAKSKKMLLLPLMRAQKRCNVTGVFFEADLSLLLWVYRTAGSFITMLMTLDEKK